MQVKRFSGDTMQEAVAQLKAEFGPDAVILHTKQIRKGLFGRFRRKRYEVLGAVDGVPKPQREQSSSFSTSPSNTGNTSRPSPTELMWPDAIEELQQRLLDADVPKELSLDLLKKVLTVVPKSSWHNQELIYQELINTIAEQISTVEPWTLGGNQGVAIFVGPTGVGKTTTIAKLAASFGLIARKKIGVITTDTYRIAAVDQLKTYTDIIGIPLEVAFSPKDMQNAIEKFSDCDLILVDTAGRSPANQMQVAEIKNYFSSLDVEIHLTVSATMKRQDVSHVVSAFGELPIDRIIITKIDETSTYGTILHLSQLTKAPIAYITTGQGVPDDIEVADGYQIAKLIMGD